LIRGAVALSALLLLLGAAAPDQKTIDRGRYLVAFGACNDCHTPGWRDRDGNVPVAQWMTGNSVGFRGPWGTVYPANVRLEFQSITEAQWLDMVRTRGGHPPMTWTNLRSLSIPDQRAIYAFIRSLGPAGAPAPYGVPAGKEPATPYIEVVPANPR
jgi:mono/diheme cytochrome c family protein